MMVPELSESSHLWGQGSLVDLFMSILVSVGLVGCLVSSSLRTSGMGNGIAVGMENPTVSNVHTTWTRPTPAVYVCRNLSLDTAIAEWQSRELSYKLLFYTH